MGQYIRSHIPVSQNKWLVVLLQDGARPIALLEGYDVFTYNWMPSEPGASETGS